MTSSTHALVGAAIGAMVGDIPAAIGLGLLSHYLLDILPHIDYIEYNRFDRKKVWIKGFSKREALGLALEGLLLITLFLVLWFAPHNRAAMAWGALFAILPDFFILLRHQTGFKWLDRLHNVFEFKKNRRYHWGRKGFLACISCEVAVALVALKIVL